MYSAPIHWYRSYIRFVPEPSNKLQAPFGIQSHGIRPKQSIRSIALYRIYRIYKSRPRQIGISVRLKVLWCARLTCASDWVRRSVRLHPFPDCQIGCCARLARLAFAPDCQIGALVRLGLFLSRPPAERLGAFHQVGRQIELSARLPKTLV